MKLYSYWRSTTSYRVRAALNLKGLSYEIVPIDLIARAQYSDTYTALNPAQGVPSLVLDDGTVLTQSLAILDYLDLTAPGPRLLPAEPLPRAREMAAAHAIALDVHPVNNLRVILALKERFGAEGEACRAWMKHWMALGFDSVEALVDPDTRFAFSDTDPGLTDLCVTAQVYNANRWGLSLDPWPRVAAITEACLSLPAFQDAHPDNQPEAKASS